MVYKKGPAYRVRPVQEICEDITEARKIYGSRVRTLFFPAGNTIAMPAKELSYICLFASEKFPSLKRITVYGSSQYIARKGLQELKSLKMGGLSRIHVGLESGDDKILRKVKKGTNASEHVEAGRFVKEAGIELSEYVVLGLGGLERTREHAAATAEVLNAIEPDFVRLRTLVPKVNTLLLHQIGRGLFQPLFPHQVLMETRDLIESLECRTHLTSDHYTNYINLTGRLPEDKEKLLREIEQALMTEENQFRPFFIGTQ